MPTRELASACKYGTAVNIIQGPMAAPEISYWQACAVRFLSWIRFIVVDVLNIPNHETE